MARYKQQTQESQAKIYWHTDQSKWMVHIKTPTLDTHLDIDGQIRDIINGTVDAIKKSKQYQKENK